MQRTLRRLLPSAKSLLSSGVAKTLPFNIPSSIRLTKPIEILMKTVSSFAVLILLLQHSNGSPEKGIECTNGNYYDVLGC